MITVSKFARKFLPHRLSVINIAVKTPYSYYIFLTLAIPNYSGFYTSESLHILPGNVLIALERCCSQRHGAHAYPVPLLPFPLSPFPLPSSIPSLLPSSSRPAHPSLFPFPIPSPSLPRSGPLNPARVWGSAVSSFSGVWRAAPAEIEFGAF